MGIVDIDPLWSTFARKERSKDCARIANAHYSDQRIRWAFAVSSAGGYWIMFSL